MWLVKSAKRLIGGRLSRSNRLTYIMKRCRFDFFKEKKKKKNKKFSF